MSQVSHHMLQEAERELQELLSRKKVVDRSLVDLERKIYLIEGSYLEETSNGNLVKGFSDYLNSHATRKKTKLNEGDRLFSRSSVTYPKALEMGRDRGLADDGGDDDNGGSSSRGTPARTTDRTKKSTVKKRASSLLTPDLETPLQKKKRARGADDA
ncbi:hypothetical protein HDU89_005267 [Geranomyces variabilis]|nr:histone acetyltransferase subunit NuA4-domain-containing protein [Geranomyces variabilis]KAJ3135827.1 hypothetical protein HDU90_003566 [Geranomyces variabilis]KAJ3147649.1 hypothetical protein HDU89_005267 [Geranomyces variabilis]KAJ3161025.1 hypothetical protein HDU88_007441 [Geranomyces variabilis]